TVSVVVVVVAAGGIVSVTAPPNVLVVTGVPAEAGGTLIGERIDISAEPPTPSDVAVIVTGPGATPVTSPVADTVAISLSDDVHVTGRSSVAPPALRGCALSCTVAAV